MTYKFFRFYSTAFLSFLLVMSILALQIQPVDASSKSPYESGYDHGCDDADISDPSERYINQPEKGPSFHTNEFMRGYNDGYDVCSHDSSNGNGDFRGDGDNSENNAGYLLTVIVSDHPFGTSTVDIDILTENGHMDSKKVSTTGGASATFDIPSSQGSSVRVCVDAGLLHFEQCQGFVANGNNFKVEMSADDTS